MKVDHGARMPHSTNLKRATSWWRVAEARRGARSPRECERRASTRMLRSVRHEATRAKSVCGRCAVYACWPSETIGEVTTTRRREQTHRPSFHSAEDEAAGRGVVERVASAWAVEARVAAARVAAVRVAAATAAAMAAATAAAATAQEDKSDTFYPVFTPLS